MTSIMTATAHTGIIPVDENTVRNTATPYDVNAPAAEAPSMPDMNETETDPNPNLGMVNRQLGSHVVPTEKYAPFWQTNADDNHLLTDIVDRQIGSSGTAAAREASGQFGHGTMQVMEGITPVADLVDGGQMTNTYFAAGKPPIQENMRHDMSVPPGQDHSVPAMAGNASSNAARDATSASMYDTFYNNTVGS